MYSGPAMGFRIRPGWRAKGWWLSLLAWCWALGCETPLEPRDPLRVPIQLRAKGSCGLSPVLYDAPCLAAVEVSVRDRNGLLLSKHCEPIRPRFASLADLLNAATSTLSFATLSDQGAVRFRITGVHDAGALAEVSEKGICTNTDQPRHWLFWGESDLIDLRQMELSDAGLLSIDLPIDCRDCAGGCANLATSQCPASMPLSYCVPYAVGLTCARRCDNDQECYEAQVTCNPETERCDPALGNPQSGNTGAFCFPCRFSSDCDLGYSCVASPGEEEGFCAPRCPENRCLDGAMCKRIGADLRLLDQNTGSSAAEN